MTDEIYSEIRDQAYLSFLSYGIYPQEISTSRMKLIYEKVQDKGEDKLIIPEFDPGDKVEICRGSLKGMEGKVDGISKNYVTVCLHIFGRKTSVKLDKKDIIKI